MLVGGSRLSASSPRATTHCAFGACPSTTAVEPAMIAASARTGIESRNPRMGLPSVDHLYTSEVLEAPTGSIIAAVVSSGRRRDAGCSPSPLHSVVPAIILGPWPAPLHPSAGRPARWRDRRA